MNYELAKQLKDLGFEQPDAEFAPGNYQTDFDAKAKITGFTYLPTLSELIEALASTFGALFSTMGGYRAKGNGIEVPGKNPTEAVAKLWLKLNEKM